VPPAAAASLAGFCDARPAIAGFCNSGEYRQQVIEGSVCPAVRAASTLSWDVVATTAGALHKPVVAAYYW